MRTDTYNLTLRPLYKCVRAELMEMGARSIYWHQGPVNAPLCCAFRPLAPLCREAVA